MQLVRRAAREFWAHFPAWMFFVYGCLLLNCELTNFDPPRQDLAFTVAFPLAVFVVYYVSRALRAPDVQNRRRLLVTTVGLAVGLPLLNLAWHRPYPLSAAAIRTAYEVSNFAWAGLMLFHALRRNRGHAALFFGAGLLYGVLLENGGIALGFFAETHLASAVKPFLAPVATMVGWCIVVYMAFFVVWGLRSFYPWLRRSAALSALAVALVALMLDLQIDPIATALGCWVWSPALPAAFLGVPLVNFVAWMCALFPVGYAVFRYQGIARIRDAAAWTPRQVGLAVAAVPVVLAVASVLFLAATALAEGPNGPSWTMLYRFFDLHLA